MGTSDVVDVPSPVVLPLSDRPGGRDVESTAGPDLGSFYASSRNRISELVSRRNDSVSRRCDVVACPGWSVHDTVAHLVGVVEDGLAGRLSGPPDEAMTATQVERHRDDSIEDLVTVWDDLAPMFEAVVTERQIWAAVLDVVSHEHDIRAAFGEPGARDDLAVRLGAQRLAVLDVPVVIDVSGVADAQLPLADGIEARLTTSAFGSPVPSWPAQRGPGAGAAVDR